MGNDCGRGIFSFPEELGKDCISTSLKSRDAHLLAWLPETNKPKISRLIDLVATSMAKRTSHLYRLKVSTGLKQIWDEQSVKNCGSFHTCATYAREM